MNIHYCAGCLSIDKCCCFCYRMGTHALAPSSQNTMLLYSIAKYTSYSYVGKCRARMAYIVYIYIYSVASRAIRYYHVCTAQCACLVNLLVLMEIDDFEMYLSTYGISFTQHNGCEESLRAHFLYSSTRDACPCVAWICWCVGNIKCTSEHGTSFMIMTQ